MITLPAEYKARMRALLGAEYPLYEEALTCLPHRGFRVNTDKISLADFAVVNTLSTERIPFVETGYYLTEEKIGHHPFHHAGMIYVQEPAAMAPAECVEIDPSWKILDMCAAPGGKSTQLKNKLGERGFLVSNEIIPARCKVLTGNIERLGLRNTVTTCMDTARLAATFPRTFDMVMVDAPCSGEGMFRKEAEAVAEWSAENVAMCARRQAEILENAAAVLKSGGTIVYATCTFSLEENECVIDAFLARHPAFALVPVTDSVRMHTADGICFDGCRTKNMHFARRFYPHTGRGEGQFMAVLRHMGERAVSTCTQEKERRAPDKAVLSFLDDVLVSYDRDAVREYNGNPVYFPGGMSIGRGVAFCCGVTIGEVRKNYIQPHHQFFMAMGKNFRRKIELSHDRDTLTAYLRGEEIFTDCTGGWAVVTVHGCAVGGAKVVAGRAKNHYPKGLRLRG